MQVIILDIDGTLMDTHYLHVEAWAQAFATVGHHVPRAAIHRQIGKGPQLLIDDFIQDKVIGKRVDELHGEFFAHMQPQSYPLPDAKELLTTLSARELACWFATSAKPAELQYYVEQLEVAETIAGVVSSQDVEQAKPAPDLFELTLYGAGCRSEEWIGVGETVWDIQAGERLWASHCGRIDWRRFQPPRTGRSWGRSSLPGLYRTFGSRISGKAGYPPHGDYRRT